MTYTKGNFEICFILLAERWVNNRICRLYPSAGFTHTKKWVRNSNIDTFCPSQKTIIDKIKDFVEKQLELITQPFEFNQKNTINSETEKLEIAVVSGTEAIEEHREIIVVDDGVPAVILIN